jgi:hypothetical protein
MDTIFHKTTSVFNCVSVARNEPRRYGKNGEVLIDYEQTDEAEIRRQSAAGPAGSKREAVGEQLQMENGDARKMSQGSSFVAKQE